MRLTVHLISILLILLLNSCSPTRTVPAASPAVVTVTETTEVTSTATIHPTVDTKPLIPTNTPVPDPTVLPTSSSFPTPIVPIRQSECPTIKDAGGPVEIENGSLLYALAFIGEQEDNKILALSAGNTEAVPIYLGPYFPWSLSPESTSLLLHNRPNEIVVMNLTSGEQKKYEMPDRWTSGIWDNDKVLRFLIGGNENDDEASRYLLINIETGELDFHEELLDLPGFYRTFTPLYGGNAILDPKREVGLYTADYLRLLIMRNIRSGNELWRLPIIAQTFSTGDWTTDGTKIAFGAHPVDDDGPIIYILMKDGTLLHQIDLSELHNSGRIENVTWSPDNRYLYFRVDDFYSSPRIHQYLYDIEQKTVRSFCIPPGLEFERGEGWSGNSRYYFFVTVKYGEDYKLLERKLWYLDTHDWILQELEPNNARWIGWTPVEW